jgi:hypothetical protein
MKAMREESGADPEPNEICDACKGQGGRVAWPE